MLVSIASLSRRLLFRAFLVLASLAIFGGDAFAQTDPLPSWNDGAAKKSIVDFVPEIDVRLVVFPAEKHFTAADDRRKIHEARGHVFRDSAQTVNVTDVVFDRFQPEINLRMNAVVFRRQRAGVFRRALKFFRFGATGLHMFENAF